MPTIKWRAISAIMFSAALVLVFSLLPDLKLASLGENKLVVWSGVLAVFWLYLVVQGYPVAHGQIGSSSTHNLDNIISSLPALIALFGIFVSVLGFWRLSSFNIAIAVMTLLVAIYDLWVLGGVALRINRIAHEYKVER